MNEIKVITELCAEDRARLDRLAEALEKYTHKCAIIPADQVDPDQMAVDPEMLAAEKKLAELINEEPKNEPQEPTKEEVPASTPTEEEKPAEVKETPAEPTVTLAEIQQKVVQLAADNGGAKKAKVREIINAYGAKVSDLKDLPDKWNEVWEKLTALEKE